MKKRFLALLLSAALALSLTACGDVVKVENYGGNNDSRGDTNMVDLLRQHATKYNARNLLKQKDCGRFSACVRACVSLKSGNHKSM
ncbi:MAG: hypothetical protein EOM52_11250 [Clostridia bacterium]|nr:hypothetical protein [Clostridia bacterium]